MKSKINLIYLVVVFLLVLTTSVFAYTISGTVKNSNNQNINVALVNITDLSNIQIATSITDINGFYAITISDVSSTFKIKTYKPGYLESTNGFFNNQNNVINFVLISGTIDSDDDSITDISDNCPLTSNSNQLNTDGDIWQAGSSNTGGDACDTDDDNDGDLDATDCSSLNRYIFSGNTNTFCSCPSNPITDVCGNGIDEDCSGADASCPTGGGSSGGGGGGSPGELICSEKLFNCADWSNCNPDGTMSRTCNMTRKCIGGIKPETKKTCTYYPKEEPEQEAPVVITNQTVNTPMGAVTYNIGSIVLTKNRVWYGGTGLGVILLILIGLGIYKLTRPKIIEHIPEPVINQVAEEFVRKKKRK